MASDKSQTKSVSDWPTIKENQWYALAITSAIFTAVAILAAFAWIFGDGFDGDADLKKAQALAPFGVALFAVVTFCAASWRGSINTRQADQAEREGRAKLLQEGAKLLGQRDNPSHVSAGIATLEILAVGADQRLAIQAMNLIADLVQGQMATSHANQFREEAFSALANAAAMGRVATRSLVFKTDDPKTTWEPLEGVRSVKYVGGNIEGGFFGYFEDSERYRYEDLNLSGFEIRVDHRFKNCTFEYCHVISYGTKFGPSQRENLNFRKCDFSGCIFTGVENIPDFRPGENFVTGRYPVMAGKVKQNADWSSHFLLDHDPFS